MSTWKKMLVAMEDNWMGTEDRSRRNNSRGKQWEDHQNRPCAAPETRPHVQAGSRLFIYLFVYSFIAAADRVQGFVCASRVLYCWAMAPALDSETRMSFKLTKRRKGPWKLWEPHTQAEWEQRMHWGRRVPEVDGGESCFSGSAHCGKSVAAASRNLSLVMYSFLSCYYVNRM